MQVVLLGAGKLAGHLGPALAKKGIEVSAVYNRHAGRARVLAQRIGAETQATDQIGQLPQNADLYLLAVADQAISEVAAQLAAQLGPDLPLVHTSGATEAAVLASFTRQYGVFYPLQSFSVGRDVDFQLIPLCIHAVADGLLERLWACAQKMSQRVYMLDDAQRAQLHVAGVFANNFVNHILGQSHQLLAKADIPKSILFNLIRETIEKLEQQDAASAQTGPAIRGDEDTIRRHLALLESTPAEKVVYQLITQQIKESTKSTIQ